MKRYLFFTIFSLALFFSPAIIYAQGFTGPRLVDNSGIQSGAITVEHPVSVVEARELPHDSWVILTGNIVNALPSGKHYTFRDPSGEIIVSIGTKDWRGLSVDVSDKVEISGKVRHKGQASVRVYAIRKI